MDDELAANQKYSTMRGRGASIQPRNRFEPIHMEADFEHMTNEDWEDETKKHQTKFYIDQSRSIISENNSPDVGFRFSLNPYRGCEHGCAYCYARPTHEYLGYSAGLDFESRIFVKQRAAELFREWLADERWNPNTIAFSGITDCYQPAERCFQLTRKCLTVALEAKQPISIVTKNALVTRDLDLLREMARHGIVHVSISVTTLDESLARSLEPRTTAPTGRLRSITQLKQAGVPVRVMVAPVIPGLNDSEIPQILRSAAEAGADSAAYTLLRLPLTVRPIFLDWLNRYLPSSAGRVESYIRATREGRLNDANFGNRMRGTGPLAEQISRTFEVFRKRYGLDGNLPVLETSQFLPPRPISGQLRLF